MPEQVAGEATASNWLEEAAKPVEEKPVVEAESQETPETETKEKVEEKIEKVVPLAALHEERAKRREATAREQALSQQVEQMRRQQLEWMQQQQRPQTQAPDQAVDPLGNMIHKVDATQAEVAAMRLSQFQEQQRNVQQQQFQNFVATVRAKNDEFVKEQPDANEAIGFLKSNRVKEYEAMGMSSQEATNRMMHDEMQLSQWALSNGENPAAVAYRMAESRGYTAPAKKIEMQANGQRASMPNASGKGGGMPSLDALLKMDSKDFAKATEGDNWSKLMKKHGA